MIKFCDINRPFYITAIAFILLLIVSMAYFLVWIVAVALAPLLAWAMFLVPVGWFILHAYDQYAKSTKGK